MTLTEYCAIYPVIGPRATRNPPAVRPRGAQCAPHWASRVGGARARALRPAPPRYVRTLRRVRAPCARLAPVCASVALLHNRAHSPRPRPWARGRPRPYRAHCAGFQTATPPSTAKDTKQGFCIICRFVGSLPLSPSSRNLWLLRAAPLLRRSVRLWAFRAAPRRRAASVHTKSMFCIIRGANGFLLRSVALFSLRRRFRPAPFCFLAACVATPAP